MQQKTKACEHTKARAWQYLAQNKIKQAIVCCQEFNQQNPSDAAGWQVTAELALEINKPKVALQALTKAQQCGGNEVDLIILKSRAMYLTYQWQLAKQQLAEVQLVAIDNSRQCQELGAISQLIDGHDLALAFFKKGIELDPDSGDLYFNLATSYRFIGDLNQAQICLDRAIELNPEDAQAWHLRSSLNKQTEQNNHIEQLQAQLDHHKEQAHYYYFALAKELEDIGQYEQAFHALQQGAQHKRSVLQFDLDAERNRHRYIKSDFSKAKSAVFTPSNCQQNPIFILGLPRVGSTLVEQILGTDNRVKPVGEIDTFGFVFQRQLHQAQGDLTKVNFSEVGRAYCELVQGQMFDTELRTIDKLPFNYLNIGAIKAALPNSKIILVEREPMDSCYAMYKNLFNQGYPFSYDLTELAAYYKLYKELVEHWQTELELEVHQVQYEQLVTQPEEVTKALFEYCELDWRVECLDFHKNKSVSTTASASQIRNPVYRSSVGKWQCYRHQLQELSAALKD